MNVFSHVLLVLLLKGDNNDNNIVDHVVSKANFLLVTISHRVTVAEFELCFRVFSRTTFIIFAPMDEALQL